MQSPHPPSPCHALSDTLRTMAVTFACTTFPAQVTPRAPCNACAATVGGSSVCSPLSHAPPHTPPSLSPGYSPVGPTPRSRDRVVDEIRAALVASGRNGPCVCPFAWLCVQHFPQLRRSVLSQIATVAFCQQRDDVSTRYALVTTGLGGNFALSFALK